MALFLFRRTIRRCFSSANTPGIQFESLSLEKDQVLPALIVTQRVLKYLLVDHKDIQRVVSALELRPLPHKVWFASQQVHRLTPLVQWGFQQLEDKSRAVDAVFSALEPHANMTRGAVWQQYFQRQFFLSGAPLRAYLLAYKRHQDAHAAATEKAAVKEEEDEDEDEDDQEQMEKGDEEVTRRKDDNCLNKSKADIILIENKEWQWVPIYVAVGLVKEFCFRGRFSEAIEAYVSLPLTDTGRREVVTILQDYEQYPSVLYLYEVHRAMGNAVRPLDVAPELNALKKVGRVEEMKVRFQELPAKEQSRADIQELMGN
ncbi:unnamed protein product [Peronospora destructor]|uniref:Uncharacterized protein n=1 Tax=Peronospora destructor TaxID=86335 RepID=A0AAV0TQY9_9STRA|nr:unnamed protein product [Peronospora destructor]